MPVVGDEDDVFAVAKVRERHRRLDRGVAEHRESILVVGEIVARFFARELAAPVLPQTLAKKSG